MPRTVTPMGAQALRPRWRSLIMQLAGYFLALALPVLLLVESTVLLSEYMGFRRDVEAGMLLRGVQREAKNLGREWPVLSTSQYALIRDLESWVLKLERPRGVLGESKSMVLLELADQPFAVAVVNADGTVVTHAPRNGWRIEEGFARARHVATVELIETKDGSDILMRRYAAAIRDQGGRYVGWLLLELRLPKPWRKLALDLSFEWPILLSYLVVFALGSAFFLGWYVTRRLNRIATAAEAWRRGDFSMSIGDRSRDELGRLSALLDQMADDLRDLVVARSALASLNERQRLARDLHDTVKQKAFALNLQLATARALLGEASPPAAERLAEAQRLTAQIQRELAQTLDELRSTSDGSADLNALLRERVDAWTRLSGLPVALAVADARDIAPAHREELLRIVDEALANVLRHSGASRVELSLQPDGPRTMLRVADDGRGVGTTRGEGMGIGNMRARALSLPDGRFEIESEPDRGTTITVSFRKQPETST